ncbi:MAG: hypothetical protein ACM3OC_04215 [Deltaproteobacteria bacterium]
MIGGVLRDEALEWCKGKSWLVRLPLLLFFAYILLRHLADPAYASIIAPLDLGIHELGHLVFSLLGQDVQVAGGTILQLAVPVYAVFNFHSQRDFFGIAMSFGWISANLFEVARYAGDARALQLPLVSLFGGESVVHDWEYMLEKLRLLQADAVIACGIRVLGAITFLLCMVLGSWLLWNMYREKGTGNA